MRWTKVQWSGWRLCGAAWQSSRSRGVRGIETASSWARGMRGPVAPDRANHTGCRDGAADGALRRIRALFHVDGEGDYIGEPVSIAEHSIQSAAAAKRMGHPDVVVLAALLHDVGHMLGTEAGFKPAMDGCGTESHERVGADFLRQLGFSEDVAWLVEQHVNAKRYLCATDKEYYAKLSGASRTTLKFQGGPMSAQEVAAAEADSRWPTVLSMREVDEAAKDPFFREGAEAETLDSFTGILRAHVTRAAPYSYVLSTEQRRKWAEDGVLHIRGALPPFMAAPAALSAMAQGLLALDGHGVQVWVDKCGWGCVCGCVSV
jgi:putative nucleotidyltransferase with HDIG domain